ncbi:MAG: hypothetical protein IKN85_14075 [Oscillospiraceae bacterium]|nr:hypothetical protein [Oscillospiraceae bacterium]MBR6986199.1 hypothetical protein [Ruminococcus sp.]
MLNTPELTMNRRRSVTTVCRGIKKKWNDREAAMEYFLEAMMCSDTPEDHDRYSGIYIQLRNGLSYCTDEEE